MNILLPFNSRPAKKGAMLCATLTLLAVAFASQASDEHLIGNVEIISDVKAKDPKNPTAPEIFAAQWRFAYNGCNKKYGQGRTKSVRLESIEAVQPDGQQSLVSAYWYCREIP